MTASPHRWSANVYGHTSGDTARSAVDALADQFGILDL